jgi:hypothetical protein
LHSVENIPAERDELRKDGGFTIHRLSLARINELVLSPVTGSLRPIADTC